PDGAPVRRARRAGAGTGARARGARLRRARPDDMQLPAEIQPYLQAPARRVDDQDEYSRVGFGSGFLASPRGVVVTNNHVVDGADRALVQLRDGRKFYSKDIKTDPKTDLAIIRLENRSGLPALEFGDSDQMEIG